MKQHYFCVWFVLTAAFWGGCVDPEIGVVDGSVEDGEDAPEDLLTACKRCMATADDPGPGCQMTYDPCVSNKKCNDTLECIYEAGCFGASPRSFLGCGTPCGTKAGLLSGNDPALPIAQALFYCLTAGPCKAACFTVDL